MLCYNMLYCYLSVVSASRILYHHVTDYYITYHFRWLCLELKGGVKCY